MDSVAQFSGTELRLLRQRRKLSQTKLALLLDVPQRICPNGNATICRWGSAGVPPAVFGVLAEYIFPFRDTRNGATGRSRSPKHFQSELWNFLIPISTNMPALTASAQTPFRRIRALDVHAKTLLA
jgi:hypothetical protein